ncbi:MAG TPA: fatty acid cis/trans isomerase [Candidatus Methylomirabilis sp.]|nr:fatty acid cis/trans isomerase [Candidatus Methylomirabilis sp.]
MTRPIAVALLVAALLGGCVMLARVQLDDRYGPSDPRNRGGPAVEMQTVDYQHDVRPIIESRCVVCHSCYDAPCQLNLSAADGIERGANKTKVYDGTRLVAGDLTRLFEDARTPEQWRDKGFFPVLNERAQTPQANIEGGVMARLLMLKRAYPLPGSATLPDSFDLSLDRHQQCTTIDEFDRFAEKQPLWGMPYALPGLTDREYHILMTWIGNGARFPAPEPPPRAYVTRIAQWEDFLNGGSAKQQLMSRYIFEHLFLADLYFDDMPNGRFFRLVRSRTPPGEPVDYIATRRPYDDPGVKSFYYRIEPVRTTILAKTHLPYALGDSRRQRYRELFLEAPYAVSRLPSYALDTASNPFVTFQDIPVRSRYRFLLDDALFYVMGFIKGPVCRGQVALNVINDKFWVVFATPDAEASAGVEAFLAAESTKLQLPAKEGSSAFALLPWLKYSDLEREYLQAKARFLNRALSGPRSVTSDLIWDGDGDNSNAALTVFRHFDSASVVRGLVGDDPKTAWVIGYPLLERIHYLLVAGFDVYGNVGHQLNTRLYMDFLRMEGEFNFLALLPKSMRQREVDFWYRGAGDHVKKYIDGEIVNLEQDSAISYRTAAPKAELYATLKRRLAPVLNHAYSLDEEPDKELRRQLQRLAKVHGGAVSWLPQLALLSVVPDNAGVGAAGKMFSLINNSAHSNIAGLFSDEKNRLPAEDTLTVARGIVGAYPNAFYRVTRRQLPTFVDAVASLNGEAAYARLVTDFGVRRTDSRFWPHVDAVHAAYRKNAPLEFGLLDYSRLENR